MVRKIITPSWVDNKTIYEINLRQFTEEGTIKAFEGHLSRLKDLGVGILWFMPIHPIGRKNRKASLGSYYSISDYSAINTEFGTLGEFRSLVDKIHEMGMRVIIDWVANHTAWDHNWTLEHPEFYSKEKNGEFKAPFPEWEDVIELDYSISKLWDAMIDQMLFWLRDFDIDGFRCDMAHLVPTPFWNKARKELDKVKPVYMLAESENHDLLEYAFDTIYNWKFLHGLNDLAAIKITGKDLLDLAINEIHLPDGASFLNFTSNHDENSWQGSAIERLHYYLEPLTVFSFFIPGIPLIYSGQEAGNYRRLKFFDKDELVWKKDKMFELYQMLNQLKQTNSALSFNAEIAKIKNDSDGSVISFSRKNEYNSLLVLINLSDHQQSCYVKCKDLEGEWKNVLTEDESVISCSEQIPMEDYGFKIFKKN